MIIGFESDELSQRHNIAEAVAIARECGGHVDDDEIRVNDGSAAPTGREGAVGAWRDAFIGVGLGLDTSLGLVADTFETAITWDRWPDFDAVVRERVSSALSKVFGHDADALVPVHARRTPTGPRPITRGRESGVRALRSRCGQR